MPRTKTLALILAGGAGSRLEVLTAERAKPVMPFAGVYRLIDFPLTNCLHSGISDVWVIEQYELHSLNEHLANGRPWDLDRTYGGLQVLPPHQSKSRSDEGGFAQGNADAIYRHKTLIRELDPDLLLVLSADHVYKLDYREVIDRHQERDTAVTMVTTRLPPGEDASRFGVVEADGDGRVTGFEYKPESPKGDLVTTEVFVYAAAELLDTLDRLADETDGEESGLKDFGHELIPLLVRDGRAREYRLDGYWRDVGTVESYWRAHMDLLEREPGLVLDDPAWPLRTYASQRLPVRVEGTARIDGSLISPGCRIAGRVERSVLGPGVIVEEGAEVRDSVLLDEVVVSAGAKVERAILDSEVRVGKGASVGEKDGDLALAGRRVEIAPGARIPQGACLAL
jgi:glucose-1-phosphate adenylyltransferase